MQRLCDLDGWRETLVKLNIDLHWIAHEADID